MKYTKTVSFFLLSFFLQTIYSQTKFSDDLKLSASSHFGYSLPEYSFISFLTEDHVKSFELNVLKETSGKNPWETLYNYPEYGISFIYTTLGNEKVFGNAFALNYFFKIHFINKLRFKFYNRTGIGLGYLTKKYDKDFNYMNLAIGSHFNVHFVFKLGTQFKLSEKISATAGISFDHFSNANTHDPNRGLNLVTGEIGLEYAIGTKSAKLSPEFQAFTKETYFTIVGSTGGKQPRSFEKNYYNTVSLAVSINRSVLRAIHFGVGLDLFYDSYAKPFLENQMLAHKAADSFQTGFSITQQFIYNRFRIILQEGVYIGLTNKVISKLIYNRAAVQYDINDKLIVRLSMKSHLHILDYPEIGVGIKL